MCNKYLQQVPVYGNILFVAKTPACRNGRRGRLKICCWQQRAGSSPAAGIKILIGISYDGYTDFFIFHVSSEAIFDNTMAISMIKLSVLFCRIKKKVR